MKDRRDTSVLLLIDNTTAVAYINHQGGTVSPMATEIAMDLWMWCLERDITIKAQYLPGVENVRADSESRVIQDRSDWMLNRQIFQAIQAQLGPVDLDLFASRLTAQLPQYLSWRPDPLALATDALLQDWEGLRAYANPPWNLLGMQSPSKGPERAGGSSANDRTSVANTALVPEPVRPVDRLPEVDSSGREHSLGNSSVASSSSSATASRVAYLKQRYSSESLSTGAGKLLLASWRAKSAILCSRNGLAGVRSGIQIPFLDL